MAMKFSSGKTVVLTAEAISRIPEFVTLAEKMGIDLEDGYIEFCVNWPENTVTWTHLVVVMEEDVQG